MGKLKTPVIIILAILFVDQALKFWVKTNMMLGDEFSVFGDWFYIHFVENNGMAFGMELGGDFGKIFLSVFRIIAVVGIGWYLYKLTLKKAPVGLVISVSMVLAGALGNIIDSAFYGMIFNHSYSQLATLFPEGGGYASFLHGRVVDMFYFPLFSGTYPDWLPWLGGQDYIFFRPVFNIADSSITLGIISILIFQKKFFEHETEQ
ncbi:lipoprotein signal peptidase [Marinilabilia salmonicolor]|uniref:lipoprotein signal peptidase n=1 Tax=Marinilabilia salmonicolor TaxID=989 RepID=UPI00029A6593|nr:lipoprotein signal peptidase [Marinilabilia salmonicolor]